jgi:8-amino-7-oxononanoate synthase
MMDLLDKLAPVRAALEGVDGANPFGVTIERVCSPAVVQIDGRRTLMFGSNNYLGLTRDERVVGAGIEALREWGSGTTGSRVANGTTALHRGLEQALAAAFSAAHASVFSTGHQANLSLVAGLCGPDDVVLMDMESHASLYDAARLSGATALVFRHNDAADLRRKLARLPAGATNRLVVTEGLFSTSGDVAPLADIVEASRAGGAYVLVDEAHSFGVYGPSGLGCAADQGVLADVDFLVGTFSKSLGGVGGFAVSRHDALALLHFTARAYLFTASSSASTIAAAHAALELLLDADDRRARLRRQTHRFRTGLSDLADATGTFTVGAGESPIVAVYPGGPTRALDAWQALLAAGVYVNLVLPPACPRDKARLRVSCTAAHGDDEVDEALEAFARVMTREPSRSLM